MAKAKSNSSSRRPALRSSLPDDGAPKEMWRFMTPNSISWKKGVTLAYDMLERIETTSLDLAAIEDNCREGAPQWNVALPFLRDFRKMADPEAVAAFAAALTDYVSTAKRSGEPDISVMRRIARVPIATTG